MARTILDIFKPEIDEQIDIAVKKAELSSRQRVLYELVQDGNMMPDMAAQYAGISRADFIRQMTEAGYSVPDST